MQKTSLLQHVANLRIKTDKSKHPRTFICLFVDLFVHYFVY
nr:MAG TPA: hypothetical protein [Caudoviricetes sp.]